MAHSKSRPPARPVHAVRAYAELERHVIAFAEGHLRLLIVFGPPGTAKSRIVRSLVGPRACWVHGTATPFGIYRLAHEAIDRPIVLDDVDNLCRDRRGVRLLKALCQSDPVKTVSWETDAATLLREGIPRSFDTSSPVAVIANDWQALGPDVAALEDRGHVLEFLPTPTEVHRRAATFFENREILDFVADHLHLVGVHSLRTYVLAREQKQAGLDWRSFVLSRCLSGTALHVARFRSDPALATVDAQVRAFVAAGHGCRATFFNYLKRLRFREGLSGTSPSDPV